MSRVENVTEILVEEPAKYWCRREVAEAYDSGRFDNLKGRVYRWREERAIELALRGVPPGTRVLDAACGTGRIAELLHRNGYHPTGCDVSQAMMAVARERFAAFGYELPLVESRVEHVPYLDKSFDAVTCVGLLMHLDADARVKALRELARVSRGPIVVQYGCIDPFRLVSSRAARGPIGGVQHSVSEAEMGVDFERSGLTPLEKYWVLRRFSSSLIVLLAKLERA